MGVSIVFVLLSIIGWFLSALISNTDANNRKKPPEVIPNTMVKSFIRVFSCALSPDCSRFSDSWICCVSRSSIAVISAFILLLSSVSWQYKVSLLLVVNQKKGLRVGVFPNRAAPCFRLKLITERVILWEIVRFPSNNHEAIRGDVSFCFRGLRAHTRGSHNFSFYMIPKMLSILFLLFVDTLKLLCQNIVIIWRDFVLGDW